MGKAKMAKQAIKDINPEIWVCLALVAAAVVVFGPVADFGFVNFDDPRYFQDNRFMRMGLTGESIAWALTDGIATTGYWAPLTLISLLVDSQIYKLNAGGYHVTNLWLHIANGLLLFHFFRRTTGDIWPAALVALLFTIHPLHVESVAWITERKDVLSTLLWLLTMLAYYRYSRSPGSGRYLAVLVIFIAGIMAKPMLVTLPVVLLLLDYWPLGRLSGQIANGRSVPPTGLLRLVLEKIPFLFIALVAGLVAYFFQKKIGAVASLADISLGTRITNTLVAYTRYIQDMVWPAELAVLYPHPGQLPLWMPVISALILLGITFLVFRSTTRHPYLVVGWLWYLITLAPVSGIVVIGPHATADRYTYVPLVGLFIMIAWAAQALYGWKKVVRVGLTAFTVILLVALGVQARTQTMTWENSVTLFEHALKVTRLNETAHLNLGSAYGERGRSDEALIQYRKALQINPASARAHMNIGNLRLKAGDIDSALRSFSLAMQIDPTLPGIYNDIGNAYLQLNEARQAEVRFRQALRNQPFDEKAHNGLGVALILQGRAAEARYHFEKALSINPGYPSARRNLDKLLGRPVALGNPTDGES